MAPLPQQLPGRPVAGPGLNARLQRLLGPALAFAVFAAALYVLHGELSGVSWRGVLARMGALPGAAIAGSLALTLASYSLLSGYDRLALAWVGRHLPYRQVAATAFMAYAIGFNVGLSALSAGSVRYRIYSGLGLSTFEIARIVAFCSVTFTLGCSLLVGAALWVLPAGELTRLPLAPVWQKVLGTALVAYPAAYLAYAFMHRQPLRLGSWQIDVPRPGIAAAQIPLACLDLVCSAGALYVLVQSQLDIGFVEFLGVYLVAIAAGVLSGIPGGLGVVEGILLVAFPDAGRTALLGSVLVYRLIYYVAPLAVAVAALSVRELRQRRTILRMSGVGAGWGRIVPETAGALVFLGGVVLLVSGATPAVDARLHLLMRLLPLPLLELSHMAGSLLGVALLVVAHGLVRRLHAAMLAAMAALLAGAVASLLKGVDVEEALLLCAVAAALWAVRGEFHRRGSLLAHPLSPGGIAAVIMVMAATAWFLLLGFRHLDYTQQLWWQFSFNAQAPRALRATSLAVVALGAYALARLLQTRPPEPVLLDRAGMARVEVIIAGADGVAANAALLGDKRILFSDANDAFVMYQVSGGSWIALGDPVGPVASWPELIWRFRELCDRHAGRPVFYEVASRHLDYYIDAGFSMAKLGETARVPLAGFSLQGSGRAGLRHARNRARREGAVLEVVPRERVPSIVTSLGEISDDWLARKATHEKGFSMGRFDEDYLRHFDCAVVRVGERIVAFANLWSAPAAGELSVDLMRYHRQAPPGTMDFLFVELMLWGREHGFVWFDLGMAPLAGLDRHPLAPLWHKVGNLVYRHSEGLYGFEGLHAYKDKFDPLWEPRYLASPTGWQSARALIDAAVLIAGGWRELLGR